MKSLVWDLAQKELNYNRYRQVSINTVKPSISHKIIEEGGSSLEPSENSSKEMARLPMGGQRLHSSPTGQGSAREIKVVRHFTLNPCGAGDISS